MHEPPVEVRLDHLLGQVTSLHRQQQKVECWRRMSNAFCYTTIAGKRVRYRKTAAPIDQQIVAAKCLFSRNSPCATSWSGILVTVWQPPAVVGGSNTNARSSRLSITRNQRFGIVHLGRKQILMHRRICPSSSSATNIPEVVGCRP